MTKDETLNLVKRHLGAHQPKGYRIEVVPDATRQDDDWWYVTVRADNPDVPRYDYYNVLAIVEREIQDENDDNNILLVPVASGVT